MVLKNTKFKPYIPWLIHVHAFFSFEEQHVLKGEQKLPDGSSSLPDGSSSLPNGSSSLIDMLPLTGARTRLASYTVLVIIFK